jgi:pyruvate kinase
MLEGPEHPGSTPLPGLNGSLDNNPGTLAALIRRHATTGLLQNLATQIDGLISHVNRAERDFAAELALVHPTLAESARNLVHFDALAHIDLSALKHELRSLGLNGELCSPFAVLPTLKSVRTALGVMGGSMSDLSALGSNRVEIEKLEALAPAHGAEALGPVPASYRTRIMVSSHGDLATDDSKVRELVAAGMNILRINCAHGDPAQWRTIAAQTRAAAHELGRDVRIACDLAGPKVRTGALQNHTPIDLVVGDTLRVMRDPAPGKNRRVGADGSLEAPATISCTLPEVFSAAQPGHRVLFDDGNIAGVIERADAETLDVRITYVLNDHHPLLAKKGINLPDTILSVPALSDRDREALRTVVEIADMVALSFTRSAADIADLEDELTRLNGQHLTVILKPETPQAVEDLPRLILGAMRSPPVAIMIPRGDLAVELGFERLSAAQERLLSYGEAAHIGVIWATQVLERLTNLGTPARAEITDVIAGARADCIMLPYGPHIVKAVKFLAELLPHTSTE